MLGENRRRARGVEFVQSQKFAEAHRLIEQKDLKDGKKILKDLGVLGRDSLKHQSKVQKRAVEKTFKVRHLAVAKTQNNS